MHNNIRVSVVATGIDCEKRSDPLENIISDVKTNEGSIYTTNRIETEEKINKNNLLNKEEDLKLEISPNFIGEEVLEKVMEVKQESFIPPEPEVFEKTIINHTEIQIDPFTEAEVLNASSSIETNALKNDQVSEVKETESLIKRFTGKSIFGNTNKKNSESIEIKKSNLDEDSNNINNELSLSQDISMKSTEKNSNEDALDIPAFLRRQRE
jgi:hypothetical protein